MIKVDLEVVIYNNSTPVVVYSIGCQLYITISFLRTAVSRYEFFENENISVVDESHSR